MNSKTKTIMLILALALFIFIAYTLYNFLSNRYSDNNQSGNGSTTDESAAPDFTVYDINGKAVKLSDFNGKPVVLNFWASWCPPCKGEMPYFDEAYKEYGDCVMFLMVDLVDGSRETNTSGLEYIRNMGYSFDIYLDTKQDAAIAYEVYSIPTTYFINTEGRIVSKYTGMIDEKTLNNAIKSIYKGKCLY